MQKWTVNLHPLWIESRVLLCVDNRQHQCRWMRRIVIDRLLGDAHACRVRDRFAGAEVTIPTWVRAAGYLQSNAMPAFEAISRGPHIDLDAQAAIGLPLAFARLNAE